MQLVTINLKPPTVKKQVSSQHQLLKSIPTKVGRLIQQPGGPIKYYLVKKCRTKIHQNAKIFPSSKNNSHTLCRKEPGKIAILMPNSFLDYQPKRYHSGKSHETI